MSRAPHSSTEAGEDPGGFDGGCGCGWLSGIALQGRGRRLRADRREDVGNLRNRGSVERRDRDTQDHAQWVEPRVASRTGRAATQ
ncbi:hypothetical protein GCM10010503_63050 [Streptomyces lucensis JCM 4490]|uniref:Uncharacterized protein n=1 Tax=Streptomyces lucensis JCM 4490 TaxID=1306176 RepID=A0A918JHV0_9ACTN|nr:hypothetical protein GCM10010503_63050 [Streptomyces lucensis JCM 4490]